MILLILVSCEESKNNKEKEAAEYAIELASKAEQVNYEAPFGLKFNMSKAEVQTFLNELSNDNVVFNLNENSFEYKYPEYDGLISEVELFYVDDTLSRLVFQFKNSTEFHEDWLEEFRSLLSHNMGISETFDYYIPTEGIKPENSDKRFVRVDNNIVFMKKEVKYGSILDDETIYIYENKPISKELEEYKTEKELKLGEKRINDIKEREEYIDEHKKEIKQSIKEQELENKLKKVENSTLDGSVRQVKDYLKQNLKDPKSYEPIEWSEVYRNGNNYIVRHKYRAKNSFGGYVISNQKFVLNSEGNIISVTDIE